MINPEATGVAETACQEQKEQNMALIAKGIGIRTETHLSDALAAAMSASQTFSHARPTPRSTKKGLVEAQYPNTFRELLQ